MERSIACLLHCPLEYSVTSECELTSTSPSFIVKSFTHFNKKIYNFKYTHAFTLSTYIHFNIQNIPLFYLKENFIPHSQTIQSMQILFNAPHMHACKSWVTHAFSFNAWILEAHAWMLKASQRWCLHFNKLTDMLTTFLPRFSHRSTYGFALPHDLSLLHSRTHNPMAIITTLLQLEPWARYSHADAQHHAQMLQGWQREQWSIWLWYQIKMGRINSHNTKRFHYLTNKWRLHI